MKIYSSRRDLCEYHNLILIGEMVVKGILAEIHRIPLDCWRRPCPSQKSKSLTFVDLLIWFLSFPVRPKWICKVVDWTKFGFQLCFYQNKIHLNLFCRLSKVYQTELRVHCCRNKKSWTRVGITESAASGGGQRRTRRVSARLTAQPRQLSGSSDVRYTSLAPTCSVNTFTNLHRQCRRRKKENGQVNPVRFGGKSAWGRWTMWQKRGRDLWWTSWWTTRPRTLSMGACSRSWTSR